MRGRPRREGPDIRVTLAMFGPFNAIRHDPNGIGYSYHYYERFMAVVPEVATLAIDGVPAEPGTIATGRYPLVTSVYLAHRADLDRRFALRRLPPDPLLRRHGAGADRDLRGRDPFRSGCSPPGDRLREVGVHRGLQPRLWPAG